MPEQTPSQWTRAQLDADIDALNAALLDWEQEQDLRVGLDEASAALDDLWEQLSEKNAEALEAQYRYFDNPDPDANFMALLDFQIATRDLIPLQQAYRVGAKAQRALRVQWDAYHAELAGRRRADLLAKLEYVQSLIPAPTQDELDVAQIIYRSGRSGRPRWEYADPEIQAECIAMARAQIESEKTDGR